MPRILALIFFTCVVFFHGPAFAADDGFAQWLGEFGVDALRNGVSQDTVERALSDLTVDPRVLSLDHRQPETTISFLRYRASVVSPERIRAGRVNMNLHADELSEASHIYGIPPQYIVALWGIETSYGQNTGNFDTIRSLATLAWRGRRQDFFRGELMRALQIIDEGDIDRDGMKGSWAGAMGQNQFMPSSFLIFAADGDGDGRRNIWTDRRDVFASTANYLARSGWNADQSWGRAVYVPRGMDASYITIDRRRPLSEWKTLGVTLPNGEPLPNKDINASLIAPDGMGGATFLVYDNYRAIMRWNRSTYFATAVGLLADAIAKGY